MRTLSCSMEDLGPCPRIELSPSALRAQRASHLATGQVPYVLVLRTCRIIFLSSCTIFFPLNLIFLFMFSFSFTVLALNLPRSLKMVYYFLLQALVGPKVLLSSGKVQFKAQEQEGKLNLLKPQLGSRNPRSGSWTLSLLSLNYSRIGQDAHTQTGSHRM